MLHSDWLLHSFVKEGFVYSVRKSISVAFLNYNLMFVSYRPKFSYWWNKFTNVYETEIETSLETKQGCLIKVLPENDTNCSS